MPMSRYEGRNLKRNANRLYSNVFKDRDVKYIRQYTTSIHRPLTKEQLDRIRVIDHTWVLGDRFYKLADKHYGDSELWWVIAWFNMTPTESHLKLGDSLSIPFPLEIVLSYYEG